MKIVNTRIHKNGQLMIILLLGTVNLYLAYLRQIAGVFFAQISYRHYYWLDRCFFGALLWFHSQLDIG